MKNPILFLEHKALYGKKGEIPEGKYVIPLGKEDIARPGTDIILVVDMWMVHSIDVAAGEEVEVGVVLCFILAHGS